ncbi:hypothetical protein KSP39_PZI010519 [Platanthera zijinensis]|uniref:GAG-pre-integrase domain-containing protein n=1 Tax=Platanthera zijinensis TaxID=2320716 RepID=A0AAP0G6Z1_9ASPA
MSPKVYHSYMLMDSAYEIWTRARETYSQIGNSTHVYELTRRMLELRQGSMTVSTYYSEFERISQELDYFDQFAPACTADAVLLQRRDERFHLHVFLMGLSMELDMFRTNILHRSPLPSLTEAFSMVLGDEDRRRSLNTVAPPSDRSAFTSTGRGGSSHTTQIPTCDHCGRRGHSREACFKLHPHLAPPGYVCGRGRGRGPGRGGHRQTDTRSHNAAYSTEIQGGHQGQLPDHFTTFELDALRRLLHSQSDPTPSSSSLFSTAAMPSAHAAVTPSSEWIIDSGATNYMTGFFTGFYSYTPLSGKDKVVSANGTLSPIAGKGNFSCSSSLPLTSVLHVPSFLRSLRSISNLTKSLNCSVNFFSDSYIFQELGTKRILGSGRNRGGLYYLDATLSSLALSSSAVTTADARRWHFCLGHPSPVYLQKFFPTLSQFVSSFKCDVCEMSKHVRQSSSHLSSPSSVPFSVIHSDVWGPSPVVSLTGYRWFVTFIDCFSRTTWVYL